MARTHWNSSHANLDGLSEEGKAMGEELTGQANPTVHDVLKAAWKAQRDNHSVSDFVSSAPTRILFPGVSERAIDTRIYKHIEPEIEEGTTDQKETGNAEDQEEDRTVNLFEQFECEMERTHVAIQSGRTYREPILVRVSSQKRAPYERVEVGDRVFLKASGGPILRYSTVKRVDSFENASESTEEILELVRGTELENDEEFEAYISDTTSSGKPRNYCTVVSFEPWNDLENRVTVHPPKGIASSWVVMDSERKIERYLVGEEDRTVQEKARERILKKHEKGEGQ
ncbi:MAG: hypothetical protein ACOX9R_08595 [Armatimonadota bacterium]